MVAEALAAPARARIASVPIVAALAGLVSASIAVRWLVALARPTPVLFPDETTYAALARGIAESGRPLIRGEFAYFPSLLEPILAAPFWLLGDPELAYRLTQGLHALAMSLAAVPVYLLGRELGLRAGVSFTCAAIAVAAPGMAYSGYVLADPIGYPLALAAVYAGVRALVRPTPRAQLAFLALAALATLARIQYAVLVVAFLAAAVAVERGRPRRFRLSFGLALVPPVLLAAINPGRFLGAYWSAVEDGIDPIGVASWLPDDLLLLGYGAGWVLAPAAAVGVVAALVRPRSRAESAFAWMAVVTGAALVLGAAAVAELDARRFQERYLIALVPLAALAAATSWSRGGTVRRTAAAAAVVLLVVAMRIPISEYTVGVGISDSPTLWAATYVQRSLGLADGALVVSVVAALLALLAAIAALRPRPFGPAALGAALVACGALSAGAHALDTTNTRNVGEKTFPDGKRWVDRAGFASVALLQPPVASKQHALIHLFWNRSVDEILVFPTTRRPDPFAVTQVDVDPSGRLLAGDRLVRKPLLVDESGTRVELTGAEAVRRTPSFTLWRLGPSPRVSMLAAGFYHDGWLAPKGSVRLWPDASGRTRGTLHLTVSSLPRHFGMTTELQLSGAGFARRVTLTPGATRQLAIPVDTAGVFSLELLATSSVFSGGRMIAAGAPRLLFVREPGVKADRRDADTF